MQHKLPVGLRTNCCGNIVREVNKKHRTNVSYRTVLDRVRKGIGDTAPRFRRGRKSGLNPELYAALQSAISSYILLSNAEMKRKPNRKKLIASLKLCLKKNFCDLRRIDHLYNRISKSIADDIEVSSMNEKVEHCCLMWTSFDSINK